MSIRKETDFHTNLSEIYNQGSIPGHGSHVLDMDGPRHAMEKVASSETHVPQKLEEAIREIQANPEDDFTYLYDRALGAGEIYGPNNNGDWFGDKEIRNRHHTFVDHGSVFRHHQNSNPDNGIGEVVVSAYNDPLSVVDLILKVPTDEVREERQKPKDGGTVATSMGARVPYDVCSICGNKARTRSMYCKHLRSKMLDMFPNGDIVCAKNPKPKFVDISFVVVRAAPESVVLEKVASLSDPGEAPARYKEASNQETRGVIRPEVIDSTNHLDRPEALATLDEAYGSLRPDEFQAVMQKDASCLTPDCVPYVWMKKLEKTASLNGVPNRDIVRMLERVSQQSLDGSSKKEASFLTPHEKHAYLQYRRSSDRSDHRFLR